MSGGVRTGVLCTPRKTHTHPSVAILAQELVSSRRPLAAFFSDDGCGANAGKAGLSGGTTSRHAIREPGGKGGIRGRQRAARWQWQARRWQWQARREPGRQGRQRAAREAKETRNGGKGTAKGGKGSQWQRAAREAAKGTASAVSSEAVWKGPQGKRQRKRQAQPRLSLAQSGNRALSRSLAPRRALSRPQPKPKPTSSRALSCTSFASPAFWAE